VTGATSAEAPTSECRAVRRQRRLLRLGSVIEMASFPWAFLPRSVVAQSHEWLGMGPLPEGAVVDFMIRQASFFYGMHGVLLWWLARDVVRYQPLIRLIGWTYLLFGPVFFWIDLSTGTPLWWTICDPLVTLAFGAWLLVNDARISRQTAPFACPLQPAGPESRMAAAGANRLDS
jgi:hypothetical protein